MLADGWRLRDDSQEKRFQSTEKSTSKREKPSNDKCPHCGLRGHGLTTCYKLHPELRNRKLSHGEVSEEFCVDVTFQNSKMKSPVRALVDTGSDGNLIHPNMVKKLFPHEKCVSCDHTIIHGADSKVRVDSSIEVVIRFKSPTGKQCSAPILFLISPVVGSDPIIISGVWAKNHGLLSFGGQQTADVEDEELSDLYPEELAHTPSDISEIMINEEFRSRISEVVSRHEIVFSEDMPKEGSKLSPFRVELTNSKAVWSVKPRRFPPAYDKILRDNISSGLESGLIVKESSPYMCSPVFVPKPGGGTRMCVNYIPLNRNTVPLQYPLPIVPELLDSLKGQAIFGKIDARSGFHQVPVEKESQKYLAFTTKYGVFKYTRMPFGTRNSSAHFQQAMMNAFSDLIPTVCNIFVDDIIIYGRTIEEFCLNLERVLTRFEELDLRAKACKCEFGFRSIEFLGRNVSQEGISPAESRVDDLDNLQPPQDKSQVRSVLGLFNFFRSFIPNYAKKAAPIQALTRKSVMFNWDDIVQKRFEEIKNDIRERTLLAFIDYDKNIIMQTDASDNAIGGVLLQEDSEGRIEPITFISKVLSERESRWTTNEKEAYAVKY
ncbi:hypothetical protein ADUPG1_001083, partial [Aduncisulcus paluster]